LFKVYKSFTIALIIFSFFVSEGWAQSPPKKIDKFTISYSYIGEGTSYRTPFYVIKAKKKNPKILIDAGIHGDEIAGIYAIDSILQYLQLNCGTVILVPAVNIRAVRENVRSINVDLNHVFPGDKSGSLYEDSLAYDFMELIEELKPDVVINLHEAWNKFDENSYEQKKDLSFGQTLITNYEKIPEYLINTRDRINSYIPDSSRQFRIQYFPYKPTHSMDNIIEKLKIPSYTCETLRTLNLEERINYMINVILSFMEETGIEYYYGDPE
jgi:predicted metallopeptidase